MYIGDLYLDNHTLFISLIVLIAISSLYNTLENKRLLIKINNKVKDVNNNYAHNIKLITNTIVDINKNENENTDRYYSIDSTVQDLNKSMEMIINSLFDENVGIMCDIGALKEGVYNENSGLLRKLSDIRRMINEIDEKVAKINSNEDLHYIELRDLYNSIADEMNQRNSVVQRDEDIKVES